MVIRSIGDVLVLMFLMVLYCTYKNSRCLAEGNGVNKITIVEANEV